MANLQRETRSVRLTLQIGYRNTARDIEVPMWVNNQAVQAREELCLPITIENRRLQALEQEEQGDDEEVEEETDPAQEGWKAKAKPPAMGGAKTQPGPSTHVAKKPRVRGRGRGSR